MAKRATGLLSAIVPGIAMLDGGAMRRRARVRAAWRGGGGSTRQPISQEIDMTMRIAAAAGLLAFASPAFPAMFYEVTVAKADPGDSSVVLNDWLLVNVLPTTTTWVTIDHGAFADAYISVQYIRYYAMWWSNGPDDHIYHVDDSMRWYGHITGGSVRQVLAQRDVIPADYFHCFPYPGDGVCGEWSSFYGSEVYFVVNVANDVPVTFRFYDASPGQIPEPSSWAMMIAGFGVVGGAMRRRARAHAV